jgi:ferredoxin
MADKPICGGNCNACHTCPDLQPDLSAVYKERLAFWDGVEEGKRIAELQQESERQALAAHWKDQG